MPSIPSALWPLSVEMKVTVSPTAAFTKAGSNTMAPSVPLFSIVTSKFSAWAAGASSKAARLAAISFGNMARPFEERG